MKKLLFTSLLCLMTLSMNVSYAASKNSQKAHFLYAFIKTMEWPERAFSSSQAPFNICIFGKVYFLKIFKTKITDDNRKNGRKIKIKHLKKDSSVIRCQILVIGKSRDDWSGILKSAHERPILTISSETGFIKRREGMIQFFMKKKRVYFYIVPRTNFGKKGIYADSEIFGLTLSIIVKK